MPDANELKDMAKISSIIGTRLPNLPSGFVWRSLGRWIDFHWQPIETAPKANPRDEDKYGPSILIWDGRVIGIARQEIINKDTSIRWWRYMAGPNEADFGDGDSCPICDNPTHWMPLPKPPAVRNKIKNPNPDARRK